MTQEARVRRPVESERRKESARRTPTGILISPPHACVTLAIGPPTCLLPSVDYLANSVAPPTCPTPCPPALLLLVIGGAASLDPGHRSTSPAACDVLTGELCSTAEPPGGDIRGETVTLRRSVERECDPLIGKAPQRAPDMALGGRTLLTHTMVSLFGMGSWVAVNSLWVELPVVVKELPEGWNLPAYLTVLIAFGNIGPLGVTLAHRVLPAGRIPELWLIRGIFMLSLLAAGLLAVFWARVVVVAAGAQHSVPYLLLAFLLALGCCTSNVTFLPFMFRFPQPYVRSFFIGQGLSALFPCFLAIGQGVGRLECRNNTWGNASEPHYLPVNFPAASYFWGTFTLLAVSALAFAFLPLCQRSGQEPAGQELGATSGPRDGPSPADSCPLQSPEEPAAKVVQPDFWTLRNIYLLLLLGVSSALTNGVLPSVQTYSCLPYGADAYHWSVVLSNIANPAACFIAMCALCRSALALGVIMVAGGLLAGYLMALAALSPCPPLVGSMAGIVLVVLAWSLFMGLLSYLKVVIGSLLHGAGHSGLLWCGAVIQAGSLVGALLMFPLVSVYHLFRSSRDCQESCAH